MFFICKFYYVYMSGLMAADIEGGMAHVLPEIRTVTFAAAVGGHAGLEARHVS